MLKPQVPLNARYREKLGCGSFTWVEALAMVVAAGTDAIAWSQLGERAGACGSFDQRCPRRRRARNRRRGPASAAG